jgi:hypothetical protein
MTATLTQVDLGVFELERSTKNFHRFAQDGHPPIYVAKEEFDGDPPAEVSVTVTF